MKSIKRILTIIMLCTWAESIVYAQNNATEGTEFYMTFLSNAGYASNAFGLACQIRYVVSDTCYITAQYGDGTYLDNNVYYTPGVYTKNTDKTKSYYEAGTSGTSDKMIKITSTKNIGVFALNMFHATTDATTVLPVSALGNDYTIISHTIAQQPSYIAVIAPTSGTVFTIRDPAGTAVIANQSITSYNQPYVYAGGVDDLTGYTVESNYDIAVFSAVRCGSQAPGGACDHNWEQMWPANTAGRHYLLWSMSPVDTSIVNPQGVDSYKLVALEDNTTITRKIDAAITTISLNKSQASALTTTPSGVTDNAYVNNSTGMIELTSDKPFIVDHILGHAPCIKWISSLEQRVTKAVISPFIPLGGSVITYHRLHVIIPANSESNMLIKEVRGGVESNVVLTFYTNTTNPDYKIAYKEYTQNDDVMIYMNNPGGFIAYMVGYGSFESYIFTAGAGAFDLSAYFTVDGTHYQAIDSTTLCGAGVRTFEATLWGAATGTPGYLKWYINNTEELAARDQQSWSKNLAVGTYTVRMDVLDMDNALHQYTTFFTVGTTTAITTHPSTVTATACENSGNFPATLSVAAAGSNLSYQWYRSTTASNSGGTAISGATSASYTPTSALALGDYYYYCVVTGDCGQETSNVSGKHTVTPIVIPAINITIKPD